MKKFIFFYCLWVTLCQCSTLGRARSNMNDTHSMNPRIDRDTYKGVCSKRLTKGAKRITAMGKNCKGKFMKIRKSCKDQKVYFEKSKTSKPTEWKLHVKGGAGQTYYVAFEPKQKGCKGLFLNPQVPKPPACGDPPCEEWKARPVQPILSREKKYFPMWTWGEDYDDFDLDDCPRVEILLSPEEDGYAFGINKDCNGFVVGDYEDGSMDGWTPQIEDV